MRLSINDTKNASEHPEIYTAAGQPTGRTILRGTPLAPADYLLVVHVWIRDETGHYLIQQRALDRPANPGVWAVTAGHVQAGEDSLTAAQRETHEELGLTLPPAALRSWQRLRHAHRLEDLWLATVTRAGLDAPALGPEVSAYQWATKPTLARLIAAGGFFPYSYFDQLPD